MSELPSLSNRRVFAQYVSNLDAGKHDVDYLRAQSIDVLKHFTYWGKKGLRIATDLTSFFLPHG
jgi:hypothetical protein